MDINSFLTIASLAVFLVVIALLYMRSKKQTIKIDTESFTTLDKVLEGVKNEMISIIKDDYTLNLSNEEFDRLYKRKARINEALKNCVFGIDSAKVLVRDLIRSYIESNLSIDEVSKLIGLSDDTDISNHVRFEIIMYKYKKIYGKDALVKWINRYDLARERIASDALSDDDKAYYITEEDLINTYREENITLTNEEKIDILSIIVYQMYKGFGIIDTLREMNINGFNLGTSGSILTATTKNKSIPPEFKANNAVWLYDRGKYIHLRFMNYGSEEELKRIIQLLVRWGNPGPLTSKRGFLINTMYDTSRVLALRPPASEYWAAFVRKFALSDVSPEALIIKKYTKNGEIIVKLFEYLMRGQIVTAVTGRQGSGKTTLMCSLIRYIDPRYTVRVLELAPELYLRELYPSRNILSVQETNTISAAELQDALKKSDAAVSIVGEVASDIIAARMIQMAQVASLFTIFSHHANTAKDLVLALRNSLVNAGGFSNMQTAEKQVTDVVKVVIHLNYTPDGKRYVEKISEIVPLDESIPYPELVDDDQNSMNRITKEYYERSTDRIGFYTHDIVKYDLDTDTYNACDRFSEALEKAIKFNLSKDRKDKFDLFMLSNWGTREESSKKEAEALIEQLKSKISYNEIETANNNHSNDVSIKCSENNSESMAYKKDIKSDVNSDSEHEGKNEDTVEEFSLGSFFDDCDYSN